MSARAFLSSALLATTVVGALLLIMGLVIEPLLPLHQVDVVLTREELADPQIRERTQEMLQRARGNIGFVWMLAGLANIAAGGGGLVALGRLSASIRAETGPHTTL